MHAGRQPEDQCEAMRASKKNILSIAGFYIFLWACLGCAAVVTEVFRDSLNKPGLPVAIVFIHVAFFIGAISILTDGK